MKIEATENSFFIAFRSAFRNKFVSPFALERIYKYYLTLERKSGKEICINAEEEAPLWIEYTQKDILDKFGIFNDLEGADMNSLDDSTIMLLNSKGILIGRKIFKCGDGSFLMKNAHAGV